MSRHVPGNPTMVSTVMAGSGSLKAASYLFNAAPKDGTTLGAIGRGIATAPLLFGKRARVKFDPREFNWLGSLNSEVSICAAWHTTGVKTIADARKKSLFAPTGGTTADSAAFTFITNALLGTKFKLVAGYRGGDSQNLALESGEVESRCGWSWSSVVAVKMDWVKQGKINILAQYGLERHPDLPNVPLILDLVKTSDDRQVVEVALIRQGMGRPYVAPPGLPKARADALKKAFVATYKDPEFLAAASKLRLEINKPRSGEEVLALINRAWNMPKPILDKVKAAADRKNAQVTKRKKK
jgi:tripartite-type tricarboxylate transporter receptor subunit TctC